MPEPPVTLVPRTVITPSSASSVPELYAAAERELESGAYARAAAGFDRVFQLEPQGNLAARALFFAAVAHDHARDLEAALARFEQTARLFPNDDLAREALVRAVRVLGYLERWQRAGELCDVIFAKYADLRPYEAVSVHSAKALSLLSSADLEGMNRHVEKARSVVEEHGLDTAGAIPRELAQLYYALGELRRARAERIRFDPLPANFGAALEQRCQLLLDAQSAYSDTMRAYDSHWSAMAGYRVGELYQRLHEEVMQIQPPASANSPERRRLFEGAMRLRYSILLTKAAAMMDHTVAMAQRVGERSSWVLKAEDAKREIDRAMALENQALARLPYTRAELEAALEKLARSQVPPGASTRSPRGSGAGR